MKRKALPISSGGKALASVCVGCFSGEGKKIQHTIPSARGKNKKPRNSRNACELGVKGHGVGDKIPGLLRAGESVRKGTGDPRVTPTKLAICAPLG